MAMKRLDSWVGALNVQDYRYYIKPSMDRLVRGIKEHHNIPVILFGVGASHLINEWNDLPIDVLGLDWRTSILKADQLGVNKTLQGNLDPSLLLAPWDVLEKRVKAILDEGMQRGKPDTLKKVTQLVHDYTQK